MSTFLKLKIFLYIMCVPHSHKITFSIDDTGFELPIAGCFIISVRKLNYIQGVSKKNKNASSFKTFLEIISIYYVALSYRALVVSNLVSFSTDHMLESF